MSKGPIARVGGRFMSAYSPEIALEMVEEVANGRTLKEICAESAGRPSPTTFRRWVVNHPELAKAYLAALEASARALEDEALDTARAIALMPKDGTFVRAAEIKLAQLRWSAERRNPAQYGARASVKVNVPIQINTSLDLGEKGNVGKPVTEIQENIFKVTAQVPEPEPPLVEEQLYSPRGKMILIPPTQRRRKNNGAA